MSSVTRALALTKEGLTRFVKPESPCYDISGVDEGGLQRLFPFSYSNQVLDITYDGNNFEEVMVDVTGGADNQPLSETDTIVRVLSGPRLATSLGPNFKTYIRSWRRATIDAGSPIEVFVAPQVLRVQEAEFDNISSNSSDSWKISTFPPASDNYIAGDTTNKYRTTYVFKTPLTFTIVESGITNYITFRTVMDQE
jgi:hypothetical protein